MRSSNFSEKVEQRGTLAGKNTFGGRVVRKLVTNAIETGAQSLGILYDSRQHGFNYSEAQKYAFVNQVFKMASSGMNALVNRYIFRNSWDPWFEYFSRQINGYDPHKGVHNKFTRDSQMKKPFDLSRVNFLYPVFRIRFLLYQVGLQFCISKKIFWLSQFTLIRNTKTLLRPCFQYNQKLSSESAQLLIFW